MLDQTTELAREFLEFHDYIVKKETKFHVLKQRFGSNLTTKSFLANGVELKLKVLCHNICVLIQEFFESGARINLEECVKIKNNIYS